MQCIEVCVPDRETFETARGCFAADCTFTVVHASITRAAHPCIASAGNSFGGMSGGVDGAINTHLSSFTPEEYVQARVKRMIVERHAGELPVGCAIGVATAHPTHTLLIYAPTMRVPAPLPKDTIAPYLAFRAALLRAAYHGFRSISVPLFGTGAGEVPVERACAQMMRARASIADIPSMMFGDNELTTMRADHRSLTLL